MEVSNEELTKMLYDVYKQGFEAAVECLELGLKGIEKTFAVRGVPRLACPAGGKHEYPNDYTSPCNKCGKPRPFV